MSIVHVEEDIVCRDVFHNVGCFKTGDVADLDTAGDAYELLGHSRARNTLLYPIG